MDKEFDEQMTATETVVGPSVKIQGDLNSEGNIRIEGQVKGKVKTSQSVYVGTEAKIYADVSAGNAVVAGEIQGNIKISGKIVLQATAKIAGDITCDVLRVEEGAQFNGKANMGEPPVPLTTNGKNTKSAPRVEIEEE